MNFLRLFSASHLSSTNSPDRFIGNDNLGPIRNFILDGLQLRCNNIDGLIALPLFQALAAAEYNADAPIESSLGLGSNEHVVFLENHTTFRVAKESPGDVTVLELVDGDFAGESTVGLVEDILGCDFQTRLEVLAGEKEVECWWCNDNLWR